jgi:hypothetical protein
MVNYLRHQLTGYDRHCRDLVNQVGKLQAWRLLRKKVFDAIRTSYPWLAEQCSIQEQRE